MKEDPFAQEYKEAIDADAVCGGCGRVNPEGTLICKGCGNNLRDQRLLRLAADQILTGDEAAAKRRSLLKGGLTALGILLVLWVGLNAGNIMGMVLPGSVTDSTGAADGAPVQPGKFWESEDKAAFETMSSALKGRFPTENEADTARLNPPSNPSPDGFFALYEKVGTAERFVGAGYASLQGADLFFVAALNNGAELRGQAALTDSSAITVDWHMSGMQREGKYFAGAGSAVPQTDGTYQIVARSEAVPGVLQAVAYPMGAR
jgi:hypothetical protein